MRAKCARLSAAGRQFFLLSGMVGSKNGVLEAPYCPCPASPANLAAALAWLEPNRIAIVPDVRCAFDDVMRGEGTQIFGAAAMLGWHDAVMVLPGTHSKWARLQGGTITSFNTLMTGELYALLAPHSILAKSLAAVPVGLESSAAPQDTTAFYGVLTWRLAGKACWARCSAYGSSHCSSNCNPRRPPVSCRAW